MLITIILIISVFVLSSILWSTYKNGISPMPTSFAVKKELLKALPSSIEGPIYELGGGWGTLSFALARKYPSNQLIVFENSLVPFIFCKVINLFCRIPNLQFFAKNLYTESLVDASLVVCYLYPGAMTKLRSKFERELKPHTWVISHTFAVPDWTPQAIVRVDDLYHTPIYVYRVTSNE